MLHRLPNWVLALYTLLGVAAVAMIVIGATGGLDGTGLDATFIAAGILGAIVVSATFPLVLFHPIPRVDRRRAPPTPPATGVDESRLIAIEHALNEIRDLVTLSNETKRVLFPNRERSILRALVEQALAARHFPAAESLCRAMAEKLKLEALADQCRARIEQVRDEDSQGMAELAMAEFEACLARLDWGGAYQEAARIRAIYRDPETAAHLDERVREAREQYKLSLEEAFRDAAARDDIDGAMSILRELDRYLTRDDAARLVQDAHSIIQQHRERLGVSFQLAVQEKRWADAARVGNQIIEEYPNTKMADEVRSMIDHLRTRATEEAVAEVGR